MRRSCVRGVSPEPPNPTFGAKRGHQWMMDRSDDMSGPCAKNWAHQTRACGRQSERSHGTDGTGRRNRIRWKKTVMKSDNPWLWPVTRGIILGQITSKEFPRRWKHSCFETQFANALTAYWFAGSIDCGRHTQGRIQMWCGIRQRVGILCGHEKVDMVTLTSSTKGGAEIARR